MGVEEVLAKSLTTSAATVDTTNTESRAWIALHELRPFDVVLTRPKDAKSSKAIAAVTGVVLPRRDCRRAVPGLRIGPGGRAVLDMAAGHRAPR